MSKISIKENTIVKERFYLSLLHIQSAVLFLERVHQIEKEYDGHHSNNLIVEYLSNVTASIFATIAFLEATINEFFVDAGEKYSENRIDTGTKVLLAEKWDAISKDRRVSMMKKFDIALELAKKPKFDHGKQPTLDIALVVQLRNGLIHYYPEWLNDEISDVPSSITQKEFINKLRKKFSINPLVNDSSPFFPKKCLSFGCAQWVINSSLAYSDEFFARIGVQPSYEHIRPLIIKTKI